MKILAFSNMKKNSNCKISIIGLGYVGLPLAIEFSKFYNVVGFDTNFNRVKDLRNNVDKTKEVKNKNINIKNRILFTTDFKKMVDSEYFIITVPTPVDNKNEPDLDSLIEASNTIGSVIKKDNTVIVESTVYPGVTENIVVKNIESKTKLRWKKDFNLAYSPERINPGDTKYKLKNIKKVIGADSLITLNKVSNLYKKIIHAGVHKVSNIKIAETSKAIENAQRDINIAFINEVAMICNALKINSDEVIEAARTKWNFLDFSPGLVGGHCIGVDPFYLAKAAMKAGHNPEVILAGRKINDSMPRYLFKEIKKNLGVESKVLILGMAFKENVNDVRNSKSIELARNFLDDNLQVDCYDPLVNRTDLKKYFDITIRKPRGKYDCIIITIAHSDFKNLKKESILRLLKKNALIVDIRGAWRKIRFPSDIKVWRL